jgi:hypothetical protein
MPDFFDYTQSMNEIQHYEGPETMAVLNEGYNFFDLAGARFNEAMSNYRTDSTKADQFEAFHRLSREYYEATGERLGPNPYELDPMEKLEDYKTEDGLPMTVRGLMDLQGKRLKEQGLDSIDDRMGQLRERASGQKSEADRIAAQLGMGTNFFASAVGALPALITDPVNYSFMAAGASGQSSILRASLAEAGIQGGVELGLQPYVAGRQADLGHDYGLPEIALSVGSVAVGAGVLSGVSKAFFDNSSAISSTARQAPHSVFNLIKKMAPDNPMVTKAADILERYKFHVDADPRTRVEDGGAAALESFRVTADKILKGEPIEASALKITQRDLIKAQAELDVIGTKSATASASVFKQAFSEQEAALYRSLNQFKQAESTLFERTGVSTYKEAKEFVDSRIGQLRKDLETLDAEYHRKQNKKVKLDDRTEALQKRDRAQLREQIDYIKKAIKEDETSLQKYASTLSEATEKMLKKTDDVSPSAKRTELDKAESLRPQKGQTMVSMMTEAAESLRTVRDADLFLKQYKDTLEKLGGDTVEARLFSEMVNEMEDNVQPYQAVANTREAPARPSLKDRVEAVKGKPLEVELAEIDKELDLLAEEDFDMLIVGDDGKELTLGEELKAYKKERQLDEKFLKQIKNCAGV